MSLWESISSGIDQFAEKFDTGTGGDTDVGGQFAELHQHTQNSRLQKGDRGRYVKLLQGGLKQLGHYRGSIDGIYGPKTKAAVTSFQRDNGLVPVGEVGSTTSEALYQKIKQQERTGQLFSDLINVAAQSAAERYLYDEEEGQAGEKTKKAQEPVTVSPDKQEGTNYLMWAFGGGIVLFALSRKSQNQKS